MPWKEICTVELRQQLVRLVLGRTVSVTEMARCMGVSRKTAHKWLRRFSAGGEPALLDRSRAPRQPANRLDDAVVCRILSLRCQQPTWGAGKLRDRLLRDGLVNVPCERTVGRILQRVGWTEPTGARRRPVVPREPMWFKPTETNAVWSIDFKGHFRLGDSTVCYPLTVRDVASRYTLDIRAQYSTAAHGVFAVMEDLFQRYGLPSCIRSDNGVPFATSGLARLSELAVWWLRLGISLDLITPGRPGENGSHEQMHRVLKAETSRPPQWDMPRQQRRFDAFVETYNTQRPHEGIGMRRPAEVYTPSARAYQPIARGTDPEIQAYPGHWEQCRVSKDGMLPWAGGVLMLSTPLAGCVVGLEEVEEEVWRVHLCRSLIGIVRRARDQSGGWEVVDVTATGQPSRRRHQA